MRVAYVCADAGVPVYGHKGCSVHVQEVVRAMARRGFELHLFAPRRGGPPPRGLKQVAFHRLPTPQGTTPHDREMSSLRHNAAISRALAAAAPFDLVYERYSLWSFAAMEFSRRAGSAGVLEVNAPLIEEQARHRILTDRRRALLASCRAFQSADTLVAVSRGVAEYLASYAEAEGRIHVVPNGVDPRRFRPGRLPAVSREADAVTVGFVGSFKPWHGADVLVDAFALLAEREPALRLLLVGDGPRREELQERLGRRMGSNKQSVTWTGAVPPHRVPAYLAAMDIAVAPYARDADDYFSPLKIFEYMSAGLAMAVSSIGQLRELIENDVNGILCDPGDVQALADAIARLIGSPGLRKRLGRRARRTARAKHTWEQRLDQILSLTSCAGRRARQAI